MATTRSAGDEIRAALASAIRTNFDYTNINGFTENPTITQNPTRRTQEPYIYIYNVGQNEVYSTKDDTPYEYHLSIETCVRYDSYRGGQRQGNQMLDEVLKYVRTKNGATYPDLTSVGYNVFNVTSGDIVEITDRVRGANYYKVITDIFVTASFIDVPAILEPVQEPSFTFTDFAFTPTNRNIERYDSGDITPGTTYPSNNNGWNFIDANFSISSGSGGTFTGGVYSVPSGVEPLSLDSVLRYELDSDNTVTTSIQDTTGFRLIDSIRYGAKPAQAGVAPVFTDDTAATYGLRDLSNWNVEYGTVTPHNETVTVTGDPGEYVYIIIDHLVTLAQIRNEIGQNVIAQFTETTVGDYKIYLNTQPIVFSGFSTDFTLIATS